MAAILKTRWIWIIGGLLLLVVASLRLSSELSQYFQPVDELAGSERVPRSDPDPGWLADCDARRD